MVFGGVSWFWRLYLPRLTWLITCTLSRCTIPQWMSPSVPSGYLVPSTYPGIQVHIWTRNQAGRILHLLTFIYLEQILSGGWITTRSSESAMWCHKKTQYWRSMRNCLSLCWNSNLLQNPHCCRPIAIKTPPAVTVPTVGAGVAPSKTAASGVHSFLRKTGWLVASLRASYWFLF